MSNIMRRRICLATASSTALLVAMAGAASAQTAPQPQSPPANSDASANNGSADIIVTAQRRSESLSKTPVAVSVVSGETLAKQAILSDKDLQSAVPGLLVRATQNSNQVNYALRGQSVDAFSFGNPAVLPYENEVQIPSNASSAFFDLASVQVLKGPQGTLFGRNSTGGAVLFTTVKPTDDFEGFLTARGGNYDEVNLQGALNVPIVKDKVLLRVAGFYENHRGYQYNLYDGTYLGKVDRYAGRATLTIKPADSIENTTVVDYSHSGGSSLQSVEHSYVPTNATTPIPADFLYSPAVDTAFGPGAFASYLASRPTADAGGLVASIAAQNARGPYIANVDTDPKHNSKSFSTTNTTTFEVSDYARIKNIFGYTYATTRDVVDLDGTPYGIEYSAPVGFLNQQRQVSDELQLQGTTFAGRLKYVIGGFYLRDTTVIDEQTFFVNLTPLPSPTGFAHYGTTSVVTDYAGYAQGTYDLSDLVLKGLSITAGVRYTSEKNTQQEAPGTSLYDVADNFLSNTVDKASYQFGVNEQVDDNLLLYAVTRHSFRSAGFNGFAPPLPGYSDAGGAAFKPEIATDYEIGVKYRGDVADVPATLNLAVYREDVKDQQKTFEATADGHLIALTANIPKSRIQGFELDGTLRPMRWLSLGGSLTYTDAKFTDNVVTIEGATLAFGPYPDTPKWTGNVYADVSFPAGDLGTFNLRGELYRQSTFYFGALNNTSVPGTQLPAYTLVNLRVGLDDIQKTGVSVAFIARNLTNKVYYVGGIPTGGEYNVNSAIPGDPRLFMGELTFKF